MLNYDPNESVGIDNLEENSTEQLSYMERESEVLKEVFSELQTVDISADEKYPVLDISLYLKQPFMLSEDIEQHLNTYLDLLKLRYNDSDDKTMLRAVKISIYDRQAVFENGLTPNGNFTYMYNIENIEEGDEDDFDTMNRSLQDLGWEQTTENTKKPDYSKYDTYFDYQELEEDASIHPLSDEEFDWFLKFDKYVALGGGVPGGAKLYLQWELGANTTEGGYLVVIDTFKNFVNRLEGIGARPEYYSEDIDALRRDLVIQNPQFLLFADNQEIIEDPYEARARLIQLNPDKYTSTVESWIEDQADDYTESDDPAAIDNPENKTNSQLLEEEGLENQEDEILNQSSDGESQEESAEEPENSESE